MNHLVKCFLLSCIVLGTAVGCSSDSEAEAPATGPTMRPGDNCLRCHRSGGEAARKPWTAGGTVYPRPDSGAAQGIAGVRVLLMDAELNVFEELVTNSAGNFYTDTRLPEDFRVAVEHEGRRRDMPCTPIARSPDLGPIAPCNACHSVPPLAPAPGRIFVPAEDDPPPAPFDCADWYAGGTGR